MPGYFVEHLTATGWLRRIWPALVQARRVSPDATHRVFYVESSTCGAALAKYVCTRAKVTCERLEFDSGYVFDERGQLVWLRSYHLDMPRVLDRILADARFRGWTFPGLDPAKLRLFLRKECLPGGLIQHPAALARAVFLIQIFRWKIRTETLGSDRNLAFLQRRPWIEYVVADAVSVAPELTVKVCGDAPWRLRSLVRVLAKDLQSWVDRLRKGDLNTLSANSTTHRPEGNGPYVAVQCYGQFNLDRPAEHSDFFFWQESDLPTRNLLVCFLLPQDALTDERLSAMAAAGVRGVALRAGAAATCRAEAFPSKIPYARLAKIFGLAGHALATPEKLWLAAETQAFVGQRDYWARFFTQYNVKIFTTWFKYSSEHCAIAEALVVHDGILAIYQRAYEGNPSVKTTITADVLFAFSMHTLTVEQAAGSQIGHSVLTGYLGDHRFPLVRARARQLREGLLRRGARFVIALFDESYADDARWFPGYTRPRKQYAFLLEQVLRDPSLGLVLKPKTPATLRRMLGAAAELLDEAVACGRCVLLGDGTLQSATSPSEAALSADLAIHNSLSAGTAGIESALAGVPTLLIDEDQWRASPLYELGEGRVVFPSLDELWHTLCEARTHAGRLAELGHWDLLLAQLDPFRDGKAALRMGSYLAWLIEGYERGLGREAVLAAATARYRATWGNDKVITR